MEFVTVQARWCVRFVHDIQQGASGNCPFAVWANFCSSRETSRFQRYQQFYDQLTERSYYEAMNSIVSPLEKRQVFLIGYR